MGKKNKSRADQLLVEKGLVESREKAKRIIMASLAFIYKKNYLEPIKKPGQLIDVDEKIVLKDTERFVSRGGIKLLTAIEEFKIEFNDKIVLDVGASSGGFTDCALQHGAKKVYAVDVGYGQLHYKLRTDPRVVNLEKTNIRYIDTNIIGEKVDIVTIDCSFISLTKVIPPSVQFLKDRGELICLIKPQFELNKKEVGKGVVRDVNLQQKAIDKITNFVKTKFNFRLAGIVPSKIKGPKGNQEYLAYFIERNE
ncbi:TlyA family rRNA (cytidine-2'-O)-methyltransferase [Desulfothermus okinawensis JCM 13304]